MGEDQRPLPPMQQIVYCSLEGDLTDPPRLTDPGLRRSPSDGFGVMLNRARASLAAERERQIQARQAALLAVRRTNRRDDWERVFGR